MLFKRAAHYLWAVLIARIYEVFPLLCPLCGGQMRIIAFITHSAAQSAAVGASLRLGAVLGVVKE